MGSYIRMKDKLLESLIDKKVVVSTKGSHKFSGYIQTIKGDYITLLDVYAESEIMMEHIIEKKDIVAVSYDIKKSS